MGEWRLRRLLASVAVSLVLVPPHAEALDLATRVNDYVLRTWSREHGLPQDSVFGIAQTPDGHLWLGTEEGLVRFDGARFRVFDLGNTPEMGSQIIYSLRSDDASGALWVGTRGGGVLRVEHGRFRRYGLDEGLPSLHVFEVSIDRGGRVWAATMEGLARLEGDRFVPQDEGLGLPSGPAYALMEARDGALWIGSRHAGVSLLRDGRLSEVTVNGKRLIASAMFEDREGIVWLGTRSGLWRVQRGVATPIALEGESSVSVEVVRGDRDGGIWAGTESTLYRVAGGRVEKFTDRDGVSGAVWSLFEDREGALWVGRAVGGSMRLTNSRVRTIGRADGLVDEAVSALLEDRRGRMWIGGQSLGLTRLDGGGARTFAVADGLPSAAITTLAEDDKGRVWVGTRHGLAYIDDRGVRRIGSESPTHSSFVWSLAKGPDGDIWVGYTGGLARVRAGADVTEPIPLGAAGDLIRYVLPTRDGALLINTSNMGVWRIAGTEFQRVQLPGELLSMHEDDDGTLWTTSSTGDVARISAGQVAKTSLRGVLPASGLFGIIHDGRGRVWFTSNHGIFATSGGQLRERVEGRSSVFEFERFGRAEGMSSDECSGVGRPASIVDRVGRLWFATIRGVAVIDPAVADRMEDDPLPVSVQALRVDGNEVAYGDDVTLPPGGGLLEIDYHGLSLDRADNVRFRYRLDGLDDGWRTAGERRTAYYTKLPAGEYRFHVAAAFLGSERWHDTAAPLTVIVSPRFHETSMFFVLALLLAAGALYGAHRFRLGLVRARTAVLEERTRIAQDVHDGVAQTMAGVALQLQAARGTDATACHVEEASRLVDLALADLRKSVSALRPEPDDVQDLAAAIARLVDSCSAGPAIVRFEHEGPPVQPRVEAGTHLLRIAQEALSNALRHAHARRIDLRLTNVASGLRLTVVDDGAGFDVDASSIDPERGFGLQSMRRRARAFGGRVDVSSRIGGGTRVSVTMPAQRSRARNLVAALRRRLAARY